MWIKEQDYKRMCDDAGFWRKKHNEACKDALDKMTLIGEKEDEMRKTLVAVYDALKEKGYNPINQIVGYILSGDPAYITSHNNARALIRKVERDELVEELVRTYLKK